MPKKSARLVALLFTLLAFPGVAVAFQAPHWHADVEAYLETQLEKANLPGAAVAIVSNDEVLYTRGFGETLLERGEPITPETPFEIGSLTKSMTALAILQLHDEGRLELDAPVQAYLPWFRVADEDASKAITLRQLLSHSSGLPTGSHGVVWQDYERINPSIIESVRALERTRLNRAPGEGFEYANMGYVTLGAVIEAVTGRSWSDYIEMQILEPLAMNHSAVSQEARAELPLAQPYTWRLGRRAPAGSMSLFAAPAGSLTVASALDMAAYLQAWLAPADNGVVTPAAAREAFSPEVLAGAGEHYGLGWIVTERHDETLVYHTGGTVGSAAFMGLLPGQDLGVVVLTNSLSTLPPALGRGLLDIMLGEAPQPLGPDLARGMSLILTGLGALGLALLALLAFRVRHVVKRGWLPRRRWLLVLRAGLLVLFAGATWFLLPKVLVGAGMPVPFGIRGYPFDFALGSAALLLVSTLWALYSLAALTPLRASR